MIVGHLDNPLFELEYNTKPDQKVSVSISNSLDNMVSQWLA